MRLLFQNGFDKNYELRVREFSEKALNLCNVFRKEPEPAGKKKAANQAAFRSH